MGTYAGYQGKTRIAKRDQTAFSRQMVKILNYGGMMGFDVVYALDHEIGLLRPAKLYPGGKTIFYYNYFEDESWELAEYDSKTCSLWTEKVGSGQFADVVLAAYMLYCIYDDFRGTVGYTGSIDEEWLYGWIKHLIGDELPVSFAIGKYFEILPPCFRYNGKFFKNANFRPFPILNGNKTLFLKKSQFHFKRSRRFPNFWLFPL